MCIGFLSSLHEMNKRWTQWRRHARQEGLKSEAAHYPCRASDVCQCVLLETAAMCLLSHTRLDNHTHTREFLGHIDLTGLDALYLYLKSKELKPIKVPGQCITSKISVYTNWVVQVCVCVCLTTDVSALSMFYDTLRWQYLIVGPLDEPMKWTTATNQPSHVPFTTRKIKIIRLWWMWFKWGPVMSWSCTIFSCPTFWPLQLLKCSVLIYMKLFNLDFN